MITMMLILYGGIIATAIYFLIISGFFGGQLLLNIYSKKIWLKLIPLSVLLLVTIELLAFCILFMVNSNFSKFWLVIEIYAWGYGPIWGAVVIACLTAHIIKKRKAKKQNSVTQ
jgi:hypothetical protein